MHPVTTLHRQCVSAIWSKQTKPGVTQHDMELSSQAWVLWRLSTQAESNQQLQEARDEAAGLHVQLVNLKASQQQIQANQV